MNIRESATAPINELVILLAQTLLRRPRQHMRGQRTAASINAARPFLAQRAIDPGRERSPGLLWQARTFAMVGGGRAGVGLLAVPVHGLAQEGHLLIESSASSAARNVHSEQYAINAAQRSVLHP